MRHIISRCVKAGPLGVVAVLPKSQTSTTYDDAQCHDNRTSQKVVSPQWRALPLSSRMASTVACEPTAALPAFTSSSCLESFANSVVDVRVKKGSWRGVPQLPATKLDDEILSLSPSDCFDGSIVFKFDGKPDQGQFSPIFMRSPMNRTVAVNVGDVGLELGNGAFNKGFYKLLQNTQGLECASFETPGGPCQKYGELHGMLLQLSLEAGGGLVNIDRTSTIPGAAALLEELNLKCAYGCAGRKLIGDSPGFQGACGAVFLDVFIDEMRPHSRHNMAMLYVNGPKGKADYNVRARNDGDVLKTKPRGPLIDSPDYFVQSLDDLGRRAMQVVAYYNHLCRKTGAHDQTIEEVRWPLVSGSNVRHPDVSMVEVAMALQAGIRSAKVQKAGNITATFMYDKDEKEHAGMDRGIFWDAWNLKQMPRPSIRTRKSA